MDIGPYRVESRLALAPMAGVTDLPFRRLCRRLGAGISASEMLTSDCRLWHSAKSRRRMDHSGEPDPRVVQIAGGDPEMLAQAARFNVDAGAQIIDINMGCPAKKVCRKAAGSALMRDEGLVVRILDAVVRAVDVPVTLKMRTGWDATNRNAVRIARIAESAGVMALAVHGRTRACMFSGEAEYETIRAVKAAVRIPVFANGDIDSAHKAQSVLEQCGADGLMIGRAVQGRPWIFRQIAAALDQNRVVPEPSIAEVRVIIRDHLRDLYEFYGDEAGIRVARKHISWYVKGRSGAESFRLAVMAAETPDDQLAAVESFFDELAVGWVTGMEAAA